MRPHAAPVTATPRPVRSRAVAAAHVLAGVALVLEAIAIVLLVPRSAGVLDALDSSTIGGYVLGATYPIVGWIIATRRPGNTIGWVFLGIGLSQALDTFAGQYATVGLVTNPGGLPAADVLSWVAGWAWAPGFTLLLTMSILLFPDGRLPSGRWWPLPWMAGVALFLLVVPIAIVAWPSRGTDLLGSGPVKSSDATVSAMLVLQFAGLVLLAVTGVLSVAGMMVRFRRSRGAERAQLKWYATAGAVAVVALLVPAFFPLPGLLLNALVGLAIPPLLPIAAAIAILRYRLYDIDRIISRTISWTVTTGLIVAVFAGIVVGLQGVMAQVTRGNTLSVAASTLVAFAIFQPIRRQVQRAVDRRFNRARYDAQRTVDGFAERLRNEVDLSTLRSALVTTADDAVRPINSSVWLRVKAEPGA